MKAAMWLGRVRRVTSQFEQIGDVWLAARVLAWACVLPVLKQVVPVRSLARIMQRPPRIPVRDAAREARIVAFARWAARVRRWNSGGNCLERGLIAYRYLGAAGASPTLVVGMGRNEHDVIGHAWVLVDGRPAGETEVSLAIYTPVFAFAPDGSLLAGSSRTGAGQERS
jgi:hypothetical protein